MFEVKPWDTETDLKALFGEICAVRFVESHCGKKFVSSFVRGAPGLFGVSPRPAHPHDVSAAIGNYKGVRAPAKTGSRVVVVCFQQRGALSR